MAGQTPENPAWQAAAAIESGDTKEGVRLYRQVLETMPESAPICYNLALALAGSGSAEDIAEAKQLFRKAADLNPADADSLAELGRLEINSRRTGAAVSALDEALARDSTHPAALNNRGVAAFLKGRIEEAAEYFRKAVDADPELSDGWFNLADALEETGDTVGSMEARRQLEALGGS